MVKVRKDLTGMVFGKLTVIEQAEDYIAPSGQHFAKWLCECSCKKHTRLVVSGNNLKNGHTKSCGCIQENDTNMVKTRENLTGKIFGRLTVLKQVEDKISPTNGNKVSRWLCQCSCKGGTVIIANGIDLKQGRTKSCGCLKKEAGLQFKKENKKDLSGEYGIIWSTNTNEEIYFDLEDADKILNHCWSIDSSGYPCASINKSNVRMHVFLGFKWHDHHNKNKLDNRKNNFVLCTNQENIRNSTISKNNTSGITGVYFDCKSNKWISQITIDYKTKTLGTFIDKHDAITTRLMAEKEFFGDFAPQRHLFLEYKIL